VCALAVGFDSLKNLTDIRRQRELSSSKPLIQVFI